MPEFKYIDYETNLLDINNYVKNKDKSLLIYPNKSNVGLVQKRYQSDWCFEDIAFLSMQEFKELCFDSAKIPLKDDKRVVALYKIMESIKITDDRKREITLKQYFGVSDFFESVKVANNIFNLIEEFAEELVSYDHIIERFENNEISIYEWQKEYFNNIVLLLNCYKKWLNDNDLTDKMFNYNKESINQSYFKQYENIYVINQFYYSSLERELISRLESQGKHVYLVYQLPKENVNEKNYSCTCIDYQKLARKQDNKTEIKLYKTKNELSMYNSFCYFLKKNKDNSINQIIDRNFFQSIYAKLFSDRIIRKSDSKPIIETEVYKFLDLVKLSLEHIEWKKSNVFVPTYVFLRVITNDTFAKILEIDERKDLYEIIYNELDTNKIYLDIDSVSHKHKNSLLQVSIQRYFDFVGKFRDLNTIEKLVSFIDSSEGFLLETVCTREELRYSNIKEVIFTELANLTSFSYNNLIHRWSDLSDNVPEYMILFRLFFDGLKSREIKFESSEKRENTLNIGSLLDTRNISYQNIVFMDMVEGHTPRSRTPQFLFNDNQRKQIGLKTYDEIRMREMYYFYRLVLNSEKCYIFAYENEENNTTLSSYVEGLGLSKENIIDVANETEFLVGLKESSSKQTYQPIDGNLDIIAPEGVFKSTHYDFSNFIDNPYAYLIHNYAKVRKRKIVTNLQMDLRFVGIFTQDYINEVVKRLNNGNKEIEVNFQELTRDFFEDVYKDFYSRYKDLWYCVPHNYAMKFFDKILSRTIIDGVEEFFTKKMSKYSNQKIILLPELPNHEFWKKEHKLFITREEIINGYSMPIDVALRGNADLQIIINDKLFVVDFKTGNTVNNKQLYIYVFYYNDGNEFSLLEGEFYNVIEGKTIEKPKVITNDDIEKFKNETAEMINEVQYHGYGVGKKKANRTKIESITRADLYRIEDDNNE